MLRCTEVEQPSNASGHLLTNPPFRAMPVPPPNATRIATAPQLGGRNESPSMSAICPTSATGTNAILWLAESTVTGNAIGFDATMGGVIKSYGDNYLAAGNGSNTGSLTTVGRQ
jgi:hypothetical protein